MAFSVLVPFLVGVVLAESECATQGACEDSAFLQRNAKDVAKDAPKFDKAQLIGFSIYTFPVNTGLDKDAAMEAWNEAGPRGRGARRCWAFPKKGGGVGTPHT